MTKENLKKLACKAIDENRQNIINLANSVFIEPELGFKEEKTSLKIKNIFKELNIEYQDEIAITGVIGSVKGRKSENKVAIMAELDGIAVPSHKYADKITGASHACGHHAMLAALVGVAYALKTTGIMDYIDGDIDLMAVPAEEYGEIEYKKSLVTNGEISLVGGKQELIKLGKLDDVDAVIMQHINIADDSGMLANCGGTTNGFAAKLIKYTGKEAHAGSAPHLGINALNAASLGLQAVGMLRETFKDEDHVRVHPIITKGGDLVNVVPADVRLETYVRASNVQAILDASKKVTRAFEAGAYAIGAKVTVEDLPGYLPFFSNQDLMDIMYENMLEFIPKEKASNEIISVNFSTDAGDISNIIPTIHAYFYAAKGGLHSESFEIIDEELAYITSSKTLVMTAIDLLFDDAEQMKMVKSKFKAKMSKKEYLNSWCGI